MTGEKHQSRKLPLRRLLANARRADKTADGQSWRVAGARSDQRHDDLVSD